MRAFRAEAKASDMAKCANIIKFKGDNMKKTNNKAIGSFQKNLSLWVLICMVFGTLLGKFIPAIPQLLNKLSIAGISVPIAILIWVMIYPMMIKVDFQSIKEVGKNPKGLFITWVTNWLAIYNVCLGLLIYVCNI